MSGIYGPRNFERGKRAAFEMGAEFQANPSSDIREYKDSAAFYFREDVDAFSGLELSEKQALMTAFIAGRNAEKKYQS